MSKRQRPIEVPSSSRVKQGLHLQQSHRRRLVIEGLESRDLMAADIYYDSMGNRLGFMPRSPETVVQESYPASGLGGPENGPASAPPPLSDTFKLHSRPTATKTIFMDFDGFTARFTTWRPTGEIVSPSFDLNGNPSSFSDDELRAIQRAWQRVAADFAPFDVNVTTEDPGEAALVNTGGSDDRWGI